MVRLSSNIQSESLFNSWKRVEYSLQLGDEMQPQVVKFKWIRVFMCEGRTEREADRRIGVASSVTQTPLVTNCE